MLTFTLYELSSLSVLSCFSVAVGNPLPQITWTLDRSPLSEAWHIRVGDYVTDVYTVNSYVNISSARIEDGGLYSCAARNAAGTAIKSARVNVRGRPMIRHMANVTALSGQVLDLYCPYAGHPVQGIHWIKGQFPSEAKFRQNSFSSSSESSYPDAVLEKSASVSISAMSFSFTHRY